MDINVSPTNEHIRKIEDIIDIQKANGTFTGRQVAFNLPSESESAVSTNLLARSLESGLSKTKADGAGKNKIKKSRSKRQSSPIPDVVSWPSDSDITVLRMKLCLSTDLKEKVGDVIPGDGLHQPDSSSMVNLATLMRQSQPPSKHSIIEEYLLPLTSWEEGPDNGAECKPRIEETLPDDPFTELGHRLDSFDAVCSRQSNLGTYYEKDEFYSENSTKSKIARFLRLYFCPCCKCLYKMENMSDDPSAYWEKRKDNTIKQ